MTLFWPTFMISLCFLLLSMLSPEQLWVAVVAMAAAGCLVRRLAVLLTAAGAAALLSLSPLAAGSEAPHFLAVLALAYTLALGFRGLPAWSAHPSTAAPAPTQH
ncbi:hypothetical protein [Deinococcus multiflagellatus]|uniref:Uncharacterized protein n=1 Tax=Deinococcus multiflagellatus TaxID=1656887 RepID=A0ABW1ZV46_9DEIO|nr:hypothetical protein [Deinococcus multiflagellatus]MBZ9714452.1 hypothetical protein [Deinococcus multiflagellatus]